MKKIKTAIVSVFDKSDLIPFVSSLVKDFKIDILSTAGTGSLLEKNGIKYTKVSDYTNFPEIFDGRVKTLHPKIAGGILFRRDLEKHLKDANTYNIPRIDMVICNLYSFKEAISKPNITLNEALEMIDIGGPTMIRAAAKNYPDVVVVPSPNYYNTILDELKKKGGISEEIRAKLAQEVFIIMTDYNAAIADYLQSYYNPDIKLGDFINKTYRKVQDCRYGENWDQRAAYYLDVSTKYGLHNFKQLGGKQISFNNYLDIDSCIQMLLDFGKDHNVTAILKHTSPNGVAIDKTDLLKSVKRAYSCDPLSAFGGVWGVNQKLTKEVADFIINKEKIFVEVFLAPEFEGEALEILKQKENMRILEYGNFLDKRDEIYKQFEIRTTLGGAVIQEYDFKTIIKEWKVVSKRNVDPDEKEALIFAYKVSKWAKSNSASFVQVYKDGIYTIGIGAGQQSRIHVVKLAAQKAIEFGHRSELKDSIMGTDSFFPFPDGLEAATKAGAKAIINPGGSIRDNEVIQKADELNCALVFCGKRVFRH